MRIFGLKIVKGLIVLAALFCFLGSSAFSQTQGAGNTPSKQEEALAKNISEKMDKTIKVLNVIKGELDDYQKDVEEEQKTALGAPKTDEEEGASWGAKIGKMIKAWRKARAAIDEEIGKPEDANREEQEELVWTEDVKSKVDKTIGALEAIRKELDKIEKADSDK